MGQICQLQQSANCFNNKIGHGNSFHGSFSKLFCGTKVVVAVTKMCFYVFYMSLYINFNREKKTSIKSLVESLNHSLDICYTIWNQILYYMQQLPLSFSCCFSLQDCLIHPLLSVRALFECT